MINKSLNLKRAILILGDLAVFELALLVTLLLRYGQLDPLQLQYHLPAFSILSFLWIVAFYIAGLYDLTLVQDSFKLFRTYLEAMIANLAVAIGFFYLIPVFGIEPRTNLFVHFALSLLLGYGWRLAFSRVIANQFSRGRVLYIGPADEAGRVHELLRQSSLGLDLVAAIQTEGVPDQRLPIRWIENLGALDQTLREEKIHAIVLGVKPDDHPELKNALYQTLFTQIVLLDRAEIEEQTTGRIPLTHVSDAWFLTHLKESEKNWYETAKRVGDVALAIPFGLLTLAAIPFVAVMTKASSPGPLFIKQTRVGKGGKPFTLVKFRTMKVQSAGGMSEPNGPQFTTDAKNDPRLFPWGKFMRRTRIDEFPQIWNVLRGDLSFIGPRPERPEFVEPLIERMPYYTLRHLTRPGLTGWAQVMFLTPTAKLEDNLKKLQYDLYYIKHRSALLDLAILLKTVGIVLRRQGT
jgi:exopolysaccharide biosynthesis polyprenyl glycosylphosphotransferase